ncbi:MAG TPA: glycoside hydrolase family 43 protein [Acidimicrobiales bacterium]|nr:glycoside hydrolase family 43 protein [Acidimicrobiales bacterium]
MTTTLTQRAPATGALSGRQWGVHSTWKMALGAVMILAGGLFATRTITHAADHDVRELVGQTPSWTTPPALTTRSAAGPTHASAGRPEPESAARGEHTWLPERRVPQPPADGRDAPDPAVVHDGDVWAMFSTQVGFLNIPVAVSDDLRDWSRPVDALPELPAWAEWGHTWAPGVLRRDNGFVLYFAARSRTLGLQCIGSATAGAMEGPYTSPAAEPIVCQPHLGGSIDAQPFVDRDGTAYLLWKADANAIGQTSQLFAQRLRLDGLALAGEAVPLLRSDAGWEQPLIESPALLAADGAYLLLYSGGRWESGGYATGYAICATPLGPCVKKTTDQPLLASTADEAGTGGASVVPGPAGDHWLAYHAWTPGAIGYDNGGARSVRFGSLTWDANQLVVARRA